MRQTSLYYFECNKMNSDSQKNLHRVEQNDDTVIKLFIGYVFISSDASDYSRLGAAIGNNTHLKTLSIVLSMMKIHWTQQTLNSSMASSAIHLSVMWTLDVTSTI